MDENAKLNRCAAVTGIQFQLLLRECTDRYPLPLPPPSLSLSLPLPLTKVYYNMVISVIRVLTGKMTPETKLMDENAKLNRCAAVTGIQFQLLLRECTDRYPLPLPPLSLSLSPSPPDESLLQHGNFSD